MDSSKKSKHVIMGTAGHVDHGKTTLIKALTGTDCDTHKEEKKRGITINLGFTHLSNPDGTQIGIVDVPGHKDFIKTMISGAGGIDFVLMIIAADSSIMPQTIEHLRILEILGTKKGIIALTKTDLVDPLLTELAIEEITNFTKGTFLESSPIIQVSAKNNINIDKLKEHIYTTAAMVISEKTINFPQNNAPFRMYIDRIFSPPGIGTVITGSAISGHLRLEDSIYILPEENTKQNFRIKNMQQYGDKAELITSGERAAINVTGLKKEDFKRGMLISNTKLRDTKIIDTKTEFFQNTKAHKSSDVFQNNNPWLHVIFYIGTLETKAKIHFLNKTNHENDNIFYTQIHLDTPCICRFGDRFVIRNSSRNTTLGGGIILDSAPLHHKRRTEKVLQNLRLILSKGITELIKLEINKNFGIIDSQELAENINFSHSEIKQMLSENSEEIIILKDESSAYILVNRKKYDTLNKQLINRIHKHHKALPLTTYGLSINELEHQLNLQDYKVGKKLISHLLNLNLTKNKLKKIGKTWALIEHNATISTKLKKDIEFVENIIKQSGMTAPLMNNIVDESKNERDINNTELKQILKHLTGLKTIYRVEDSYIHSYIVNKCRETIISYLTTKTDGITVAQFRDLVNGNRKICLMLLSIYDREKTTIRDADFRYLHYKNKQV